MTPTISARGVPSTSSQALVDSHDMSRSGSDDDHTNQPTAPLQPSTNLPATTVLKDKTLHAPDDTIPRAQSVKHPGHETRPPPSHSGSLSDNRVGKAHPNDGMNNGTRTTSKGRARKCDMLLAAAWVFVPILGISLLLLGFTFYGAVRVTFSSDAAFNSTDLPAEIPSSNSYYSAINSARFVLVGSWASNIALGLFTPFMLLFSFFVAWTATREAVTEPTHMMREMLRGNQDDGLWSWAKHTSRAAFCCGRARQGESRSLHIAGAGFLSAFILR